MIHIEYEIEKALRVAIRESISKASEQVPELSTAKIIGHLLDTEQSNDDGNNDGVGLHVVLVAHPNSSEGYNTAYALEPTRSCMVDVMIITQPDSDKDRVICNAFYVAVRSVFETAPCLLVFPSGLQFGGNLISGGGSAEIDGMGQVEQFQVEMKMALI